MSAKHTPGRLSVDEYPVTLANGDLAHAKLSIVAPSKDPRYLHFSIGMVNFSAEFTGLYPSDVEEAEANARRLVACWNACEGMATDELEEIARTKAEAILAAPQPADDGWIPWAGGECPVGSEVVVTARFRFGGQITSPAKALRWFHAYDEGDIIAYRVVKP